MCASHTIAVSAARHWPQRSSGSESASATARITERMSNGFLRSGLWVAEKMSPTVAMSEPATARAAPIARHGLPGRPWRADAATLSPGTT